MGDSQNPERPSQFDGTQYVIFVRLPGRVFTTGELHEHVYGVRLDHGAKPWPYFRDAATGEWWSLACPGEQRVDALAWMIDLNQLAYKAPEEARLFLESVLPELEERAGRFGGSATPELSIPEALARMAWVREVKAVRDYTVRIVVAAPEGSGYRVAEWWHALEREGLERGDGDLFWLFNEGWSEDGTEPYKWFCAEPYSVLGYFHPGDLNSEVRFPDVALHFRLRDVPDPVGLLRRMAEVAARVASRLGAGLFTGSGAPFEIGAAEVEVLEAVERLRELRTGGV